MHNITENKSICTKIQITEISLVNLILEGRVKQTIDFNLAFLPTPSYLYGLTRR